MCEECSANYINIFFCGFFVAIIIIIILTCFGIITPGIGLSQETGDNICQHLLNNTNAVAIDYRSLSDSEIDYYDRDTLICKLPSYDNTKYINVIK